VTVIVIEVVVAVAVVIVVRSPVEVASTVQEYRLLTPCGWQDSVGIGKRRDVNPKRKRKSHDVCRNVEISHVPKQYYKVL
ncbi:hypothetical protein H4582DRAFT_1986219, partial [Lactarius indigo]